jgi:predicted O-methyltransferase YrrM
MAFHRHLVRLPPRVALFYLRARRHAERIGDADTLVGSAAPSQVAVLLRLARPHAEVVEIGTAGAWTSIAVALAHPRARVTTYDNAPRDVVADYLRLAPEAEPRITFVHGAGERPRAEPREVGLLFVDGNHEQGSTVATFQAWRERIVPGGVVVFHDFHSSWPGVRGAIDELGLSGSVTTSMFVWRAS